MAPRKLRPVVLALLLAMAFVATPAQASVLGPRPAHSPNADDIRTAYWVMLAVAAVIVIVIQAALIVTVARFRERRGRQPSRFTAGRGVLLRAGAPLALVAAAVFVFGVVTTGDVRDVQPSGPSGLGAAKALTAQVGVGNLPPVTSLQSQPTGPGEKPVTSQGGPLTAPLVINAVGQQWLWRFEYPSGPQATPGPPYDVYSYNQLVVPVDTTVILNVSSSDVIHRWFVPALGGQVDAAPGHVTQTWFRADREGTYTGQSTSFSGPSYSVMRAWVKVVSPDAYQSFVERKKRQIAAAQDFVQTRIQERATVGGVKLP